MRIINDIVQGTPEWFKLRSGVLTASHANEIVTPGCKKTSKDRFERTAFRLAGERLAQAKDDTYQSAAMERGIEMEEEARLWYEFETGNEVSQAGFILSDDGFCGCSPDGLMGVKGLEIKCPILGTHTRYLFYGDLPSEYVPQVQFSLFVAGFDCWDFFSYHPDIARKLLLHVEPDKAFQSLIREQVKRMMARVEEILETVS